MARRARLNRAMLAIVSAERQRSSALGSRRIFTIVRSPPRSVIVRRISAFVLISFRIFNAPICVHNHTVPVPRCDWAGGESTAPQIVASPPKTFSRTLDTLWSTDFQKKISKFDAIRCQILRLKCTQNLFPLGLCPRPSWGSLQRNPDPLAVR